MLYDNDSWHSDSDIEDEESDDPGMHSEILQEGAPQVAPKQIVYQEENKGLSAEVNEQFWKM